MRGEKRIAAVGLGLMLAAASACTDLPIGPGGGGSAPPDRPVEARVLTFHQGHGLPRVATILRDKEDAKAFPSWFAQVNGRGAPDTEEVAELVSARDYGKEVVVAFSYMGDCTTADGAELTSDGRVLNMRLTGTTEHEECYAPYENLAIFAVDKAKVPADAQLGGARMGTTDPAGPAELIAFVPVPGARAESRAAEVSQPDQLEAFLDPLPEAAERQLDSELGEERDPSTRRFGFILAGCRLTSAILMITPERIQPQPVGGENIRCLRAEYYAAVFSIEAELVPPEAELG